MKAAFISSIAAITASLGIVATSGVAKAYDFTCSTVDGIGNDATRTCFTQLAPDWTDIFNAPLFLPQFNSSYGTLNSAILEFDGLIQGNAGFESRNATASTITVDLSGLLTLNDADGNSLLSLNPQQFYNYDVTRYDGSTDYAGTSGKTLEGLTAEDSGSKTYTGSELTSFVGTGTVNYSFSAEATSNVRGPGNMRSYVDTKAGAGVKISYNYTRKIPEPTTVIGLGVAAGLGLFSKRNKVWKKA
ncbi:choice-of-anchor E domain-containing protein [Floridanema evergladense]|uniref:Choice-of-anchor E domain-containing protein n=1 Tax=Floridaenema evergladense BLCC-F167 TaxID=3153639 RepID=A0ABV4WLM4_9CYAN